MLFKCDCFLQWSNSQLQQGAIIVLFQMEEMGQVSVMVNNVRDANGPMSKCTHRFAFDSCYSRNCILFYNPLSEYSWKSPRGDAKSLNMTFARAAVYPIPLRTRLFYWADLTRMR